MDELESRTPEWKYAEGPLAMLVRTVQGQMLLCSEGKITHDDLEEPAVCSICNALAAASLRDALDDQFLGGVAGAFAIALTRAAIVARWLSPDDADPYEIRSRVFAQNSIEEAK